MLKIFKKSTALTVFIIILFAGFLFTSACILFLAKHNLYELIAISLIPSIVIFIIAILYEKDKFGKKTATVIFVISVVGLFIISFFAVFFDPKNPTSDIREYNKVIKYHRQNDETAFFPERITPDMQDVSFSEDITGFFGMHIPIQLFFRTSPEKIESYEQQFKNQATSILEIGDQYYGDIIDFGYGHTLRSDHNLYPDILVSEEYFTNKQLPPGYIIYFLTKPEFLNSSCGVAINKERCEILFFYLLLD